MRIWMPSAPTWRATIRLRAAERLRAADRLIQVWSLQQRVVPGAGAHMSPRLDAPSGRCLDVHVFISAIASYASRALHAEHDQVDSPGCSLGRGRDHVIHRQVAPTVPGHRPVTGSCGGSFDWTLAAEGSAAHYFRQLLAPL